MSDQIIIDPRTIPQSAEPMWVFCNESLNFISDAIDFRTNIKGIHPWDHAMISINQGRFASQSMGIFNAYREVPMDQYLKKGNQLAFVQFVNSNPDFVAAFSKSVQKRLTAPWWVTQYDYLGIIGQAVGQPWIHTPGLRYCSVDVLRHAVNACPKLPKEDQLIINSIPAEISPEALWKIVLDNPSVFTIRGQWDWTTGIIV